MTRIQMPELHPCWALTPGHVVSRADRASPTGGNDISFLTHNKVHALPFERPTDYSL
jgi:hypothetical protein